MEGIEESEDFSSREIKKEPTKSTDTTLKENINDLLYTNVKKEVPESTDIIMKGNQDFQSVEIKKEPTESVDQNIFVANGLQDFPTDGVDDHFSESTTPESVDDETSYADNESEPVPFKEELLEVTVDELSSEGMAGSSESAQGETKDKDKKGPKRRPKRYCIFCSSYQSSLRRHINNKHSKDSYFKELKERFRKMHPDSAKGQHMLFDEIRKLGIQKINEERKGGNQGIVTERSITYDAAQCKICKAYYCQSTYAAHFRNCRRKLVKVSEKSSIWKSQTLPICSENISEDLKQFLAKGKYDEVTEVIRNDPIILNFAEKRLKNITQFFPQKAGEQRKTLKNRLRALGRTFLTFNEKLAIDRVPRKNHDIFDPRNIHYLMESIKEFGTPNMHAQSYFVIIGALNALITYYKNSANNEGYSNIIETLESTRELLSREKKNIQDKQCEYMNTRRVTNVCTNELIDDDDFNRLKDWCERELEKYLGMIDDKVSIKSEQYAEIRKLVITGITFLNARRANEPSRMLISEYKKVVKEKGLDTLAPSKLRICEQEPHQTISVNVHMSKGRPSHGRMVPVVLPLYVIPAMNFLCEPEVRKRNSVNVGNKFVFPMTKNSLEHAQGNKDIRELCNRAGLPKPITSTQIRYYMAAKMRKKSDLPKDEPQD